MLFEKINLDLKESLKARDTFRVSVLRSLVAAIKNEEINLQKRESGLSEEEVVAVLQKEAKKRKDSISQYTSAGREDLAQEEIKEMTVLEGYLPEQMSEDEIRQKVQEIVTKKGEVLPSQFGQIMGEVMKELKGKADGTLVNQIVKQELS